MALDLQTPPPQAQLQNWKALKEQALANVEQGFLETALKQYGGDIKDIAADIGISNRAVYGKLKKYAIKLYRLRAVISAYP